MNHGSFLRPVLGSCFPPGISLKTLYPDVTDNWLTVWSLFSTPKQQQQQQRQQ